VAENNQHEGVFPIRLAWVIPAAAAFTIGLGLWGWLSYGAHWDDALYKALALFEINNDAYTGGVGLMDWRFRLGRWTGAGAVFSGILALAALLREHLSGALARYMKQSAVVIGSGPLAAAAFEAARRAHTSVLWLGAAEFSSASMADIALAWPLRDKPGVVRAHARQADHVLIASDDDAEALVFARAARHASPKAYVTVMMREARLAEDIGATLNEPHTRVLSAAAVAARALMIAHPAFLIAKQRQQPRIHALIVGFGQIGQSIARDLIVNCSTSYLAAPRLTVIDPSASGLEAAWRVRAPEIEASAECVFIPGQIGARSVLPAPDQLAEHLKTGGPITAAYICLSNDTDALDTTAMLQSLLRAMGLREPPIFVRLRDASVIPARGKHGLDQLISFGDLDQLLVASEFLADAPDCAARAYCEAYRAKLPAAQRDDPNNASGRPWENLDETYRQANRDAVAHIPAKLASAGIDPARWRGVAVLPKLAPGERLFHDDAELEVLATLEHARWNAQRRMDGWRYAPVRDNELRRHTYLVGYDDLPDDIQEYDRIYIRQTQDACVADVSESVRKAVPPGKRGR
jgi:hypothetical protein